MRVRRSPRLAALREDSQPCHACVNPLQEPNGAFPPSLSGPGSTELVSQGCSLHRHARESPPKPARHMFLGTYGCSFASTSFKLWRRRSC